MWNLFRYDHRFLFRNRRRASGNFVHDGPGAIRFAYMFYYSERPGTLAEKKYADDIALDVKKRRLDEIIAKQRAHSFLRNKLDVGRVHKVLIEGFSKKSNDFLQGRNTANKVVVFPAARLYP